MKIKNHFFVFSLIIVFLILCGACKKTKPVQETTEIEDYPIITISDSFSLNKDTRLYGLSEDFIKNFLVNIDNYQGTKRIMNYEIPTYWGLVGVERLPQGRELWLVQSQNREWTYLVITSGSGTQRILDVTPIALDIAREENKIIEREWWTWSRDEDGAFLVDKSYEWKKSIEDATIVNVHDYVKTSYVQDKYVIGEMGRFDCFPQDNRDSVKYRAVVFFSGQIAPDDWSDKVEYLQAFCEENQLLFADVNKSYNNVLIQDYKFQPIDTLNIVPYISKDSTGMLLFENGNIIHAVGDRSMEYMEMEIKRNFKRIKQ